MEQNSPFLHKKGPEGYGGGRERVFRVPFFYIVGV